jgi:hypothetical protein
MGIIGKLLYHRLSICSFQMLQTLWYWGALVKISQERVLSVLIVIREYLLVVEAQRHEVVEP